MADNEEILKSLTPQEIAKVCKRVRADVEKYGSANIRSSIDDEFPEYRKNREIGKYWLQDHVVEKVVGTLTASGEYIDRFREGDHGFDYMIRKNPEFPGKTALITNSNVSKKTAIIVGIATMIGILVNYCNSNTAKNALELSQKQFAINTTPYLQLTNVTDSPLIAGGYRTIHYTIQNLGQAPAKILSARFSFGGAGNIPIGTDSSKLPILVADTTPINMYAIKESPIDLTFSTQQVLYPAKIEDIRWSGDEGYFAGEIIYKNLVDSSTRIYSFGIEIKESPVRTEFRRNDNYLAPARK